MDFFEILDLSSPNIRQKYLLRTKCLDFFSLQATAVDRCDLYVLHAYYVLMQMRLHKIFDPILYHGRVSLVVRTQQVCFDETVLG